jgi:hypothetical protein
VILAYERRTHFPTYQGNARFRVDDDGAVSVQVNRDEPPLDEAWCGDYPAPRARVPGARARVEAALDRHGFAAMPPRRAADRDDGYQEQLTHQAGDGAVRTVIVDGAAAPDFRALIADLLALLDLTDEIA